jgi:sodium transport system permease protein
MSIWLVITRKELIDAVRDRRALLALLLFPIVGPFVIYFMFNTIVDIADEAKDLTLPVVGAEYAPDLVDFLRQSGIKVEPVYLGPVAEEKETQEHKKEPIENHKEPYVYPLNLHASLREKIEDRTYDFVLVIPKDFSYRMAQSRTVNIELFHESSRATAQAKVGRVQQVISYWGQETASLRLMARGISPTIINPISVQRINVASQQARAQRLLGMIPFFIIIAAFVCGMGIAVDATAGERERKSLEPLLVNPIQRTSIVVGKWMAAATFSGLGLLLVMVLNLLALSQVPLEQLGLSFSLGYVEIIGILIITLPLAFFATALQLFVGIFAKSFKDAQAYLSVISMLPMAPLFYNIFNTEDRELWMSLVPMLGQHMLLADVVAGKSPPMFDFAVAAVSVILFSLLFIYGATLVFKRERIIFS